MRVNNTFNVLNEALSKEIRRQYPLVYTEALTKSFDKLTLPENLENSLAKTPYIEALPQYQNNPLGNYGSGLEAMIDPSNLGPSKRDLIQFMEKWKNPGPFFDPYAHQVQAMKAWSKGSDIIVSTGTGSGKTECFLWPIVGHLHNYAKRVRHEPGPHRGIKALILYPMNALVADQLKRLRQLFGREVLAKELAQGALVQGGKPRPFQFGQYTGRTKFHGSYAKGGTRGGSVSSKVSKAAKQFDNYNKIRKHHSTNPNIEGGLYSQMMKKGLVPAKGKDFDLEDSFFWDMENFTEYQAALGKQNAKLITQPGDRELFFRHEMHNSGYANLTKKEANGTVPRVTDETNGGGTPDVLVTNYSMLEYMLKRPLEHGMFHETKQWLTEHPENKIMIVLDEAHLYQGALGTEVGLLVRRLLSSLGVLGSQNQNKVQFILTSASLGDDKESKQRFVHGLTGRPLEGSGEWAYKDTSEVDWSRDLTKSSIYVTGVKWKPKEGDCKDHELRELGRKLLCSDSEEHAEKILSNHLLGKTKPSKTPLGTQDAELLRSQPLFRRLYMSLLDTSLSMDELGERLFGTPIKSELNERQRTRIATEAVLNFMSSLTGTRPDSSRILPILGIRAHLLYRGLPRLYWDLANQHILLRERNSLDVSYPVRGCRKCGAPYASIWISQEKWRQVHASIVNGGSITTRSFSRPVDHSIRLEVYLYDDIVIDKGRGIGIMNIDGREIKADGPAHIWVNEDDFQVRVTDKPPEGKWIAGYLPADRRQSPTDPVLIDRETVERASKDNSGRSNVKEITFCLATCLQCNTSHRKRKTDQITDYMTRGDDAFSQLMKQLIAHQEPIPEKKELPNEGKKVMVFSDSRSRAAGLAKRIQDNSNFDELRLLVLHLLNQDWYKELHPEMRTLENLYSAFVLHCTRAKIEPFSGTGEKYRNPREFFARMRVDIIAAHSSLLNKYLDNTSFNKWPELREVVKSAKTNVSERNIALSWYEDFYARAESENDDFTFRAHRRHINYFRKYVRIIRKELYNEINRGIIDPKTNRVFTNDDRKTILGECFNPEFYNQDGDIDVVNMDFGPIEDRLNEIGISFGGKSVRDNPVSRFSIIMRGEESEYKKFKPKGWDDERWNNQLREMRDLSRDRIRKLRDVRGEPDWDAYQNCRIFLFGENKNLQELSNIARQIIEANQEFLDNRGKQRRHWRNVKKFANVGPSTPYDFSMAIFDFIGSQDFSLSSLGLGYASLSSHMKLKIRANYLEEEEDDDEEKKEEFNLHWETCLKPVLDELVHWMTRPSLGNSDSVERKSKNGGGRCIYSDPAYQFKSMKRHHSVYHKESQWGIFPIDVERKYKKLIEKFQPTITVPFDIIEEVVFSPNDHEHANGRLLVNAAAIELVHIIDDSNDLIGCPQCVTIMPKIHSATSPKSCLVCGFENLEIYDPKSPIFGQRIEIPWRQPASVAIESEYDDLKITIIRAEEHTAQINTAKDDEEMYTAAEEFELLFQDIPFTVPEEGDHWAFVQAPVDVLSCTTTMEVGIDIGSLTCVALRTTPRKASNYQQRVGRAGRGTAEVCVAVSWCDNQPHAQNYFDDPRQMLKHPNDSPVIYLDNEAIIERHVNAAIFQAFFKRMHYDLDSRSFEGMTSTKHEANLMETMGTLEGFFSPVPENEFQYLDFLNWLDGRNPSPHEDPEMSWANVKPQINAILESSNIATTLDDFVQRLKNFLNDIKQNLQQERRGLE